VGNWKVDEYTIKSGYLYPGARKVEKDIRLSNKDYDIYKALYKDRIELVLNYDLYKYYIVTLWAPNTEALKCFNAKVKEVEDNARYK
jgi:hypothetical protein